jgi:hypothetical protein
MTMGNALERLRDSEKALEAERRLLNEALQRLGATQQRMAARRTGRLIFGLDLTASRDAGIKQARIATAAMFDAIRSFGRIEMKLVYYRGVGECRESQWCADADVLSRSMLKLSCESGQTQIARLMRVALAEREKLSGVVFVGDHCEESAENMYALAGMLRDKQIPLFVFHECADRDDASLRAKPVFRRMAEISGGVYVEFKPDSGEVLKELLPTVAAFSASGIEGLNRMALPKTAEARQLQGSLRLMLGDGGK